MVFRCYKYRYKYIQVKGVTEKMTLNEKIRMKTKPVRLNY